MSRFSSSKEIHVLVHQLVHEGWRFCRGSQHGRLYPPQGSEFLSVPSTPSDRRAFLNFRQDVRRVQRHVRFFEMHHCAGE